jgi:hypothetical protein
MIARQKKLAGGIPHPTERVGDVSAFDEQDGIELSATLPNAQIPARLGADGRSFATLSVCQAHSITRKCGAVKHATPGLTPALKDFIDRAVVPALVRQALSEAGDERNLVVLEGGKRHSR